MSKSNFNFKYILKERRSCNVKAKIYNCYSTAQKE